MIGGAGYIGVKQYQKYQTKNAQEAEISNTRKMQQEATSTTSSTLELSEVEKLRQEVEELKKQQVNPYETGSKIKIEVVAPPPVITQPTTITSSPNYKPEILNILNTAKNNYISLLQYSGECVSMVSQRKTAVQQLMNPGRLITLPKVAFDSYLTQAYTLFYDIGEAELSSMDQFRIYCEATIPNSLNSNINKINDSMVSMQNSNKPATSVDLISYQAIYFGSNNIENSRANIKDVIDRANKIIITSNSQYSQILSLLNKYVSDVTTPTAPPIQYIPSIPTSPQMPQTTRCTISGDGGVGLQMHINCTTSNF
ncbi:MAG: hypothetical protein Q7S84_00420 [bacterium]|nr:hypothetical protein [bacterium]